MVEKLWIVTCKLKGELGKSKIRFWTIIENNSKLKKYYIQIDGREEAKEVSKDEGNNYFKELLRDDDKAVVNKII